MKNLFLALTLASVSLLACQTQEVPEEVTPIETDDSAMVELSSEGVLVPMQVEASFMSDHKTFSYSFNYDSNILSLSDERLTGASIAGPSFNVVGGTEIVGRTEWLSELDIVPELAASQLYGRYQVYRYFVPDGLCTLDTAVVKDSEEGLVLQLRICPNQDAEQGKQALESLLTGLRLKDLE